MAIFYFPTHEVVFIHIPKTGGASIRHGFFEGEYEGPTHGSIPEKWQGAFKFAFVRNPFDRVVSCWKMFTSGMAETNWKYPEDGRRNLSLDQFIDIAMDESIIYDERRSTFEEKLRHHAIPQTHPFNCLNEADFIGRFEAMHEDFKTVLVKLGLAGELPHLNVTRHEHYRAYYDAHTRSKVESYYAEDLKQFGYRY